MTIPATRRRQVRALFTLGLLAGPAFLWLHDTGFPGPAAGVIEAHDPAHPLPMLVSPDRRPPAAEPDSGPPTVEIRPGAGVGGRATREGNNETGREVHVAAA